MTPEFWIWNLVGFAGAVVAGSFIEWIAHKWILHSELFTSFAYKLHQVQHHTYFQGDETYEWKGDEATKWKLDHVLFVPRDYLGFIVGTAPLWLGAELLAGVPVAFGAALSTLASLQLFNSMHYRYHVPSDTWFQRTWFFRYLKEHHRIHHEDPRTNLNVAFFPLADLCLGTLKSRA